MRWPSKAPNTWPPTLVATTNSRCGSSSISSKPQICCWSLTASWNSRCAVSGRTSIIGSLGLLPERFHLGDTRARQIGVTLNVRESLAELRVGFAQSLLGVHFHESRQVHQHEK